jgi:hypothetical protein
MFYGEIRSYTERVWHVYGRIRSFTTVYRVRNRRPGLVNNGLISKFLISITLNFDKFDTESIEQLKLYRCVSFSSFKLAESKFFQVNCKGFVNTPYL